MQCRSPLLNWHDSRPYKSIGIHLVVISSKITSSEAKFRTLPKIPLTAKKAALRNCTGSTSQNISTTNWESQCIAVCSTRLLSTWSTAVYQSPTFPADVIYGQPLDITWPYHVTSSALSVVGPSPSPVRRSGTRYPTVSTTGAHQQQLQTIAENEPVSLLPLSAHSAV